ncbi:helix-turn-helix domain-containing protein [Actinosynnema sp. NPDC050801]|uniref:nSTAND1 domain-containing NTPase n=1 Tax=unclassified Actinosynnema TaxID=2637065 RepID=UPI0033D8ABC6
MRNHFALREDRMGQNGGAALATVHTKKDFGRVLTALREASGLTVRDLARRAEVPSGTVGGWCTGRHLPTLSQRAMFQRLLAECDVKSDADVRQWVECWLRLRRPLGQHVEGATPYRGLEPFQAEHAEWFFGRSRLTGLLVERVQGSPGQPVVVVGPSGSGKSSVLRAGLVATLSGNADTSPWRNVLLAPGRAPLSTLSAELAPMCDLAADAIEADLRTRPAHIAPQIRQRAAGDVLIVVDQFEEIFTDCDDAGERGAFLAALSTVAADPGVRVVIGLRADFYSDALGWPLLAEALQDNQITVGPMTDEELRQAITEPARVAGMELENGLAHVLLRDLTPADAAPGTGHTGVLPLLSHALLATWEQGGRRNMTIADYAETGGIHGAIAHTAEAAYTGLTERDRALVRQLFLRLVHVGDEATPDTRRRVLLEELTGRQDDVDHGRVRAVLGRFVDQRLLTADVDHVEISHEALLSAWPRLRDWIDGDRAGHRLHRQLTEAARNWRDAGFDPGALYRGVRLDAAVDWVGKQGHRDDLNRLERQFFDDSVEASRAERLHERRRTRRLRWLTAALAALLVLSGAATTYSVQQRGVAERERNSALSRQIAGTADRLRGTDPALAAQLAVAAYRVSPTVEARSSVLATSTGPIAARMPRLGGNLQAVAVDPAGELLLAAGAAEDDTNLVLWDVRGSGNPVRVGEPVPSGHGRPIWAVAFSPDGRTAATGSADKTVRLWDVSDPAHPRALGEPITGPEGEVLAVEFSPDGSLLAVGEAKKTFRLWDVRDREHPSPASPVLTGPTGAVQSFAFSPDGALLVLADAGRAVHVWDITPGRQRQLGAPLAFTSRVNAVAFSSDGTTFAAGSNDGTIRTWSLADPALPALAAELRGAIDWINAITFSSDGRLLAAANAGGTVQVWDLDRREVRLELPHAEPVTAVAFRQADRFLYTNSADGVARRWTVPGPVLPTSQRSITSLAFHPDLPLLVDAGKDLRLWDVAEREHPAEIGDPLAAPPGAERMTGTAALAPGGRTLASSTRADNAILLWDIGTPHRPRSHPVRLTGHSALIEDLTFSPKGDLLASTGDDSTVRLWDVADLDNPKALASFKTASGYGFAVRFSPDGQTLAGVGQNGFLQLWDTRDRLHPVPLGEQAPVARDDVRSLAFSPDGRTLALGVADGTVRLLDLATPSAPREAHPPITGPDGFIHDLDFSPDGSLLAGGSGTGQTWIWALSDQRRQPETWAVLQRPGDKTWAVRFSPDGQTLATANGDVYLWDVDPERVIPRICTTTGTAITPSEWVKHAPGAINPGTCA